MMALPAGGLGVPASMKAVLNRLKGRQGYRPVSPVMPLEFARAALQDPSFSSPYMSFAPKLRHDKAVLIEAFSNCHGGEECTLKRAAWLEDVTHLDGSARIQTVTEQSEPWL